MISDKELANRIRRLAPADNDSDWSEVIHRANRLSATKPAASGEHRRRPIRRLTAAASLVLGAAAIAVGATALVGRLSNRTQPNPSGPSVRTLMAYTEIVHAVNRRDLPASVTELIGNEKHQITTGLAPLSIQEPIVGTPSAGTPSIYLLTYPDNLCMIISIEGAVGSCYTTLSQASGALALNNVIVDGKRFITGLAANDVNSITVSAGPSQITPGTTEKATIENNVFLASLPYNGGLATSETTVTVTRTDGTTNTVQIPSNN